MLQNNRFLTLVLLSLCFTEIGRANSYEERLHNLIRAISMAPATSPTLIDDFEYILGERFHLSRIRENYPLPSVESALTMRSIQRSWPLVHTRNPVVSQRWVSNMESFFTRWLEMRRYTGTTPRSEVHHLDTSGLVSNYTHILPIISMVNPEVGQRLQIVFESILDRASFNQLVGHRFTVIGVGPQWKEGAYPFPNGFDHSAYISYILRRFERELVHPSYSENSGAENAYQQMEFYNQMGHFFEQIVAVVSRGYVRNYETVLTNVFRVKELLEMTQHIHTPQMTALLQDMVRITTRNAMQSPQFSDFFRSPEADSNLARGLSAVGEHSHEAHRVVTNVLQASNEFAKLLAENCGALLARYSRR